MSEMTQSKLTVKLTSEFVILPTLAITVKVYFSIRFASVLMMINLLSFVIQAGLNEGSLG